MKLNLSLLVLFAAVAAPFPATATENGPYTLDKVVVSASRIEEDSKSVTQAVTVITGEELRKNRHQDLGGILRRYGVQINSYTPNAGLSQIYLRGLSSATMGDDLQGSVLLLLDGRRTGTGNVSLIPMVSIERIEVIRGPAAVQYGASAVGGVVNVITRRGNEDFAAMGEIGWGSFNTFRTQGEAAGYFKGLDYALGAAYLTSNDYKAGGPKRYDNTESDGKTSYNINLGYNFLEEHRLGLSLLGVKYEDMGSPDNINAVDETAFTRRHNYSVDAGYEGGLKRLGLGWKARYYSGQSHYLNDNPVDPWGSAYYKNELDYQGAQGQLSFSKSVLTLTGGADWTKYDSKTYADYFPRPEDSTYTNMAGFILAKLSFWDDLLILSGGLRYDDYEIKIPSRSRDFDKTTPSFGLAVNPLEWLTLRGSYGQSYRIPSSQEMLGFNNGFTNYIGDPNLDPEEGRGWDAGFDAHYKTLNFAFTYFQTDYKNKILSELRGADRYYYNLGGKSEFRGLEIQADLDIGGFMDWPFKLGPYANLTRMLKYDDEDGNRIKYISKTQLAYGAVFNHPGLGLDLDLRFTYFGKQEISYYDPISYATSPDTISGKTTADLYVTQRILRTDGLGDLSIKLEARNLFDTYYYAVKEYPLPGRSFWLGLRWDY